MEVRENRSLRILHLRHLHSADFDRHCLDPVHLRQSLRVEEQLERAIRKDHGPSHGVLPQDPRDGAFLPAALLPDRVQKPGPQHVHAPRLDDHFLRSLGVLPDLPTEGLLRHGRVPQS